jgi:hypothetical protein
VEVVMAQLKSYDSTCHEGLNETKETFSQHSQQPQCVTDVAALHDDAKRFCTTNGSVLYCSFRVSPTMIEKTNKG